MDTVTDLRMQLALREVVDDLVRDGWGVVSRTPSLIVQRGRVRKEVFTARTGVHVVLTL
jgi:hypothetical protein